MPEESYIGKPQPDQGDELPAPNYYSPKHALTYPSTPKYSIIGRTHGFGPNSLPYPSPADNDIRENILQPDFKSIALTAKNITWPFAPRKNAHLTESPGPNLKRMDNEFGSNIVSASLSSRSKDGIIRAHPGNFSKPVDTHGFCTPGPANYTPHPINKQNGLAKTFGLKLHQAENVNKQFPDPGVYNIPSDFDNPNKGPIVGEILFEHTFEKSPAPNEYYIPTTNNPNITPSIKSRKIARTPFIATAPNIYFIEKIGSIGTSSVASSLQYKHFPCTSKPHPSPATYSTEFVPFEEDKGPVHGIKCLPTYPDILHYPEYGPLTTPGPQLSSLSQVKPLAPEISFSNPYHTPKPFTPGPNKYFNEKVMTSRHVKQPSYTMRPQTMHAIDHAHSSSGPANYNPRYQGHTAPAYSLRIKHANLENKDSVQTNEDLSPNSYTLEKNQTRKGVNNSPSFSFKSKFSPKVFSGFSKSVLNKLSTMNKCE